MAGYLDGGQRLFAASLLNTNVDQIGAALTSGASTGSAIRCTRPGHIGERVS